LWVLPLDIALSQQHGIRADVIPADLSREGAAQEVYRRTQGLGVPVDLRVNDAGFGTYGGFDTLTSEREHEEIMLNVTCNGYFTHPFQYLHSSLLHPSLSLPHGTRWRK
jgi:short-subunit dehydrogenase